jgi:hypothetical protein
VVLDGHVCGIRREVCGGEDVEGRGNVEKSSSSSQWSPSPTAAVVGFNSLPK